MKITSIKINNVLGARAVDVKLDKPVMLFAGKNFAGKSSIQEAVRMAMTGESIRVGLKKGYLALVTEGQETGFVQVDTDDTQYSVVLPAGKGVHSENHALPYVLDAQRFARMDDKERRTFLFGLMGIKLDGGSVTQRMLDKGLDAKKVEQIAPFLRAGFDAAQKEAAAKARDAKASWKTATGGETWGKDKAPKWQPAPLPADAEKAGTRHENALARMKEVEQEIGAAQQALGAVKAKAQARQQMAAQRDELAERASRTDRIKAKLGRDEADVVEWQAKVDETRAKAGVAPVNPKAPGEFLLRGLASVTAEFVELTYNHPEVEWDSSLLNRAIAHLAEYWKLHGDPVVGDVPAQPDADAVAKLHEYEKALSLVQSAVANDKRDLAAAEQAAAKLFELHPTARVAKVVVYESVPPERFINIECLVNDMTARASRFSAAPYPAVPYPGEPEHLSDVFRHAMQDSALRSEFVKKMSDWIAWNCRGAFLKKIGEEEVDIFWLVRMGSIGDEPSAKAHEEHRKKDKQ